MVFRGRAWKDGRLHDDPLGVGRETMRELGYRTVDLLVDWLGDDDAPPLRRASPEEMRARLSGPAPDQPEPFDEILRRLAEDVLPFASRVQHPRFFAFIPGSGTWPGALGDLIASAANIYTGSWMESAGPTQVELEVLRWFADWLGYPETAGGILVSGGSAANMTALACARETIVGGMTDEVVAYVSDQAHSSLARAARILGFRPEQVRVLPVGADQRLEPRTLAAAIDADVRAGRRPLFVSASGGSTNTGAVDGLRALAEVCAERDVWFHVDAAYGGFAVLTARGRALLDGIDLADSITLDPHKWLYQPYECGCLLVRDDRRLRSAFEITPDYLRDSAVADAAEVNLADRGLQLTRTSRALKLWVSLRYFGLAAFRTAIERSLELADLAAQRIEASATLELVAPPSLGIVCFRRRFDGLADEDELAARNAALVDALERSGVGLVSSTRLRGRYAIRLCPLNHATTAADVEQVVAFLEATEPEPHTPRATLERDRDPGRGWLRRSEVDPDSLAALPLFSPLTARERSRAAGLAGLREVAPGERIIEQWSVFRDFYVVLDGAVEVLIDDVRVRELGAGEFFGELGALDREAGFSYPRLASVVATTAARLLVFPDAALNELMRELPTVGTVIRAAAEARVQRH
jgi:glutamate/tyrosine decarboxylase-like PLP-dependent enzyme